MSGYDSWLSHRKRCIELLQKHISMVSYLPSTRAFKIAQGLLQFLLGEQEAEDRYHAYIESGATQITMPMSVEMTADYYVSCCGGREVVGMDISWPDRVELTIYPWNVYTCSRCGKMYALYIQQPEDEADE